MIPNHPLVRLPIVIGVTGHRDLRPEDLTALEDEVDAIFSRLQDTYRSTPLLLLTPLSEGADRLVARVARRREIPYRVPMPMPEQIYRQDFQLGSLATFDELLAGAGGAPYAMPFYADNDAGNLADETRRGHQYALLDAYLGRACHVFIALWDGVPSDTLAGTAQAVRFRILGVPERYLKKSSLIDAPETGPVHHVYAPRLTTVRLTHPVGTLILRTPRERSPDKPSHKPASFADVFDEIMAAPTGASDAYEALYRRIETFNRDCARVPATRATSADVSAAQSLKLAAERVASAYQRKYVTALQRLFIASAVAASAFEVYSHLLPHVRALLVLYGFAIVVALMTYVQARRGRWQDRAQDYRALEIGLNVQHAWDAAGLGESVADYYIRRQRTELDWIRDAIRTAHDVDRGRTFDEARGIAVVRAFVLEQHAYFSKRTRDGPKSEKRKSEFHENSSRWSLCLSFAFSALLVIFGLLDWFRPELLHQMPEETWQAASIFVIASAAIAAALFHDYAARRAHAQHARRYSVMAGVYERALDVLDAADMEPAWRHRADGPPRAPIDVTRECIFELGREALIENGDWLLLHRELPIELLAVG